MRVVAFFLTHWFQYNYLPLHEIWYRAADWPNMAVMLPIAIGGFLYIRSRHLAVMESHKALRSAHIEHAEKLDKLLDKLDPDTPGSLTNIENALDVSTPGGLTVILDKLAHKDP
jgi:hypothetical protein